MKVGYQETIPWRKVRLTKQRNVDLTTDGLRNAFEHKLGGSEKL